MNPISLRNVLSVGLSLSAAGLSLFPCPLDAQAPWVGSPPQPFTQVPETPQAQRSTMNSVRASVGWLKNAARTAPNYATGGDGLVWRSLEKLRVDYTAFTRSLTPKQAAEGANELAELAAGLDLLREPFTNYQDDLSRGRLPSQALRDMCQVVGRAADVWLKEFNRDCARLRVGW